MVFPAYKVDHLINKIGMISVDIIALQDIEYFEVQIKRD